MARISYIEEKDHPELAEQIGRIKGVRGGLINIYKLLLHSPGIASSWFDLINATRRTKLTGRMRELAIVRIASSFRYPYALQQHVPRIATSEGVSVEECEALKNWRLSKSFNERERALLAYVDAMVQHPEVPDDVFATLRQHFSEQEILEISVIVGAYMMHNRVFTALRVDLEPKKVEHEKLKAIMPPVIVVEDDPFTRLIPLVLDPKARDERRAAFADFMSTDEPDFEGWCARVRDAAKAIYPADIRMVDSEAEMRAALKDAAAVVVESFRVGIDDLAAAPKLKAVQKFGTRLRNIDAAACSARGIKVLTLRRRANISCAEHAFGLMLMLARKLDELDGLVTVQRITAATGAFKPYQRAHSPGGNYARIGGTRALNGATIGIIGLGEIGREIALRAKAFGMRVLYHQRTRAPEAEERELGAQHVPLMTLMAESDWIMPQLPTLPSTRDLIGRNELAAIKPGTCIVNVANAPIVNRDALIEALRKNALGGVALDVHYREPVADDDELLSFDNVILTPRMAGSPRFNGLNDFEELIVGLAQELAV